MKKNKKSVYTGVYAELAEIVGDEKVIEIYERFRGVEVTMPTRLYSAEYVIEEAKKADKEELRDIARKYGYNERYLKRLMK